MILTNVNNLPKGFVKACTTDKHNEIGTVSATTLNSGIKSVVLQERHWEKMTDDVSDRIWAIFGTAVHSLLEQEGDNDFTEEQLSFDVDGIKVSGRIDNYNMATGTVTDYKTASIWKVKFADFADWKRQGKIYSWLLRKNGFKADKCRFIAMLKDHSKTEAMRNVDYPQKPVYIYEFDVTSEMMKETESFIFGKIAEYKKALTLTDDEIEPCTASERWERPTVYAVKKEGRKTAVKLHDNEAMAIDHADGLGKGHSVEIRQGVSVKCEGYCSCNTFCNFYKDLQKNKEVTE